MAMKIGAGNTTSNRNSSNEDREPAKMWANVGFTVSDPETGDDVFISLAGVPLDNLTVRNPGSSAIMQSKAAGLQQLKDFIMALEEGTDEIISDLQVQVRHVGEREEATAETNPIIAQMSGLSFAKKKAA